MKWLRGKRLKSNRGYNITLYAFADTARVRSRVDQITSQGEWIPRSRQGAVRGERLRGAPSG